MHTHSEEIKMRTDKLCPGTVRGSRDWIAFYQTAVGELMEELDEDGITKLDSLAKSWNLDGLPPQMQDE